MPKITVVVFRDPDSNTETHLFVDGVEVKDYNLYDFDPGAGQELADVRVNAYDALSDDTLTGELRMTLQQGFEMEQDSEFTTTPNDTTFCNHCNEDVTEYVDYRNGTPRHVGYLDGAFQLTCNGTRKHTVTHEEN